MENGETRSAHAMKDQRCKQRIRAGKNNRWRQQWKQNGKAQRQNGNQEGKRGACAAKR
jgi:hypothetical protein